MATPHVNFTSLNTQNNLEMKPLPSFNTVLTLSHFQISESVPNENTQQE